MALKATIETNAAVELDGFKRSVLVAFANEQRSIANRVRQRVAEFAETNIGIPSRAFLKHRTAIIPADDGSIRLFVGLDPIRAGYVGRPEQSGRGARVGRYYFEGGFVPAHGFIPEQGKPSAGYVSIFKRVGAPKYPVVEQKVDVGDIPVQSIVDDEAGRFDLGDIGP